MKIKTKFSPFLAFNAISEPIVFITKASLKINALAPLLAFR
jgi:hypothetical protein